MNEYRGRQEGCRRGWIGRSRRRGLGGALTQHCRRVGRRFPELSVWPVGYWCRGLPASALHCRRWFLDFDLCLLSCWKRSQTRWVTTRRPIGESEKQRRGEGRASKRASERRKRLGGRLHRALIWLNVNDTVLLLLTVVDFHRTKDSLHLPCLFGRNAAFRSIGTNRI